jgi:YHS domain-containing protein
MITIRKFGYAALVLAAFAGCSQEQPPPAAPAPTPTPPAEITTEPKPAPAPEATPAEKPAPSSETPKVEAPAPSPKEEAKPEAKEEAKPEAKEEGKAAAVKLEPEEIAEIKKLPAADAEAALKQMVCPVSGEHLGSMDVPVKVSALGKTFFLCCKSCNKDVKDNPAEVVAKLKQ